MQFYPPKVSAKFHLPKNVGAVDDANATGTGATFVCGAVLRFTLRIDRVTREISAVKYKTSGCGYLIAAAETLAERINGVKLTELHGLDERFLASEIEGGIGELPAHRKHCLRLAAETLQNALADFRRAQVEEWSGEKALICTCFGVSEETIENLVKDKSLETVEEVSNLCSAGSGCGSCQPLIQEIIDSTASEIFRVESDVL